MGDKTPINLESSPSRIEVSDGHDAADCEGSTARVASGVTHSDCTETAAVIQIWPTKLSFMWHLELKLQYMMMMQLK